MTDKHPPATLSASAVQTGRSAHFVTANPVRFADTPNVYAIAWIKLKNLRGQTVNRVRIGPSRHQIDAAPAGVPSLTARITARAARLGQTRPAPLILRGATR